MALLISSELSERASRLYYSTVVRACTTIQAGLSRIGCPTLIVVGRQDFVVPEAPQLAHELIADSEVVWIEECGHYPYIEKPDAFFEALNAFVARTK